MYLVYFGSDFLAIIRGFKWVYFRPAQGLRYGPLRRYAWADDFGFQPFFPTSPKTYQRPFVFRREYFGEVFCWGRYR
jgi:hypothetical protein